MKAPFPWFGGKSRVAPDVWARFGDVYNYVEPFFGSGAVLLGRPHEPRVETINDLDGFVCNFWRASIADPDSVAKYADNPVNENDLHARHAWLVSHRDDLQSRIEGDPDFYDAKIAGWWVWGLCCWIGSGWCSGKGPWSVKDGKLVHLSGSGQGVKRKLAHLSDAGQGINRQLAHLGDAGRGVNRQRMNLGNAGQGINRKLMHLGDVFAELRDRLRNVRVCCGDWSRVCGPSPTTTLGITGVFLDPPYSSDAKRDNTIYRIDSGTVAHDVRSWAIEHGDDPLMRIALCGYDGEYTMPESWEHFAWKAHGGYASQGDGSNDNNARERVWFSPYCLKPKKQQNLFDSSSALCL